MIPPFSETPQAFLILGAIVFALGFFTVLTRKNIIGILMGIELMLNAAGINFVTFAHFRNENHLTGHVFTIFIIVLAAAETVVALSILLAIFQQRKTVMTDELKELKG